MRVLASFVVIVALAIGFATGARAAVVNADADVFVTPLGGGQTAISVSNDLFGTVSSDPAGASFVTIDGTFETTNLFAPSLVSGEIVVDGSGPDAFLTGTMTRAAFSTTDSLVFSFEPTGGTAAFAFSPGFEARIDQLALGADGFGGFAGAGTLEISQVPVPAALPLLGTGLGALLLWSRRSSRRAGSGSEAHAS